MTIIMIIRKIVRMICKKYNKLKADLIALIITWVVIIKEDIHKINYHNIITIIILEIDWIHNIIIINTIIKIQLLIIIKLN